ncbi:MAG: recombinase XerD [Bacteroidetes bacterium]|nr:recombinase XerD [Bacteroidota bacterium]
MKVELSLIEHRGLKRIAIRFEPNPELNTRVKKLPNVQCSQTNKAWLIPDTPENRKRFGIELEAPKVNVAEPKEEKKQPENLVQTETKSKGFEKNTDDVLLHIYGKHISIKLAKNNTDILFIKSFKYCKWDADIFCWVVPNYRNNLELLKNYFKDRVKDITYKETIRIKRPDELYAKEGTILCIKTKTGRLSIICEYLPELVKIIKKMGFVHWNETDKIWTANDLEENRIAIENFAQSNFLKTEYREEIRVDPGKTKLILKQPKSNKVCPEEYILKLKEMRYSENTIKTYSYSFEEYINYFHERNYEELGEEEITDYLRYLVIERKVSNSYQNQAINAIKYYYEKVLGQAKKVYAIERPRAEKKLPEVLSTSEVEDLLNVTTNLKHKTILMLCYSAGLRVSELIALKIKDIDSDRMQIRIAQSKGKKDRYTLLSTKMLALLREYFLVYRPVKFLFEGINGGQYTARSVQQFMAVSVKAAGIKKRVSVHSLRHSFATHLLENGTDLRYIQTLLGHESSKTTEIYTHVTTKGISQIINPLDRLNFK